MLLVASLLLFLLLFCNHYLLFRFCRFDCCDDDDDVLSVLEQCDLLTLAELLNKLKLNLHRSSPKGLPITFTFFQFFFGKKIILIINSTKISPEIELNNNVLNDHLHCWHTTQLLGGTNLCVGRFNYSLSHPATLLLSAPNIVVRFVLISETFSFLLSFSKPRRCSVTTSMVHFCFVIFSALLNQFSVVNLFNAFCITSVLIN